jgi:tetratricopeptide (TPR) repeat protein
MKPAKSLSAFGVACGFAGFLLATETSLDSVRLMAADGRTVEALASLEELVPAEISNPEALFLRGVLQAELGRVEEAEDTFEELIRLHPELPEPYNNLAVIQAAAGRYEEAVETLRGALQTHSSYRTAWENLTRIYGRLASEAYSKALNVGTIAEDGRVELVLLSNISEAASRPLTASPALVETSPSSSSSELPISTVPPLREKSGAVDDRAPAETIGESDGIEAAARVETEPLEEAAERGDEPAADPKATADDAVVDSEVEERISEAPVVATGIVVEDVSPSPRELAAVVESWAGSWSDQRVEDYLSYYSRSFEPAGEISRSEWEEQRRTRVTAPDFIKVSLAFVDFEIGEVSARVTVNQSYESNTFSDLVTKTLELRRETDGWKILRETVVP